MKYKEIDRFAPVASTKAVDVVAPVFTWAGEKLTRLLESHGANVTQIGEPYNTYDCNGVQKKRAVTLKIHFPKGSVKHLGLILHETRGFTIAFPDGFELRGEEHILHRSGGIVALFLPRD
jgi:hypothetical protein